MIKQGCGIVLQKDFSHQQAICLFDRHQGKIMAKPTTQDICLGALIEYQVERGRSCWHIRHIEPLAMPAINDIPELQFLHHVLEICFYVLPFDYQAADVFSHLLYLYEPSSCISTRAGQLVFLAQLLTIIGILPHEEQPTPFICKILHTPIDNKVTEAIHLESEHELSAWVYKSIAGHPCVKYFKTLSFLSESACI